MKYFFYKQNTTLFFLICFGFFAQTQEIQAQSRVKKVVLQAFWWDYWNSNHPGSYANYLTELAPRLKNMGVDAVWIPPSYKNSNAGSTGAESVGYSPFDHYDLGDKLMKSSTGYKNRTRLGTKDELLRMIAVMHANGIEVIQDIVINHVDGASVQDPEPTYSLQTAGGYKNFRYACYETPSPSSTADCDYLSLKGRWTKNYQNFHPHVGHNSTSGDWAASYWGPDICYGYENSGTGNGYGASSNCSSSCGSACHDPAQASGYMRTNVRSWLKWLVKQTGVDGFRFDAVKHFPHFVAEDVIYNTQHANDWASRGDDMFCVGEWVGSTGELDTWTSHATNGVNWRSGTFDFNLRAFAGSSSSIYDMIYQTGGSFDMGNIPSAQQTARFVDIGSQRIHRTVPFINNHDTYRPNVDASGNITGWKGGSELSPHVDIKEPRLGAAYAIIAAVDGNPQIFFEDVFNIANTGKRFSHQATSTTDLPTNSDIVNIMKAHGSLDFKSGDYKVPSNASSFWNLVTSSINNDDIIVIERGGKALIAATDSWNVDQNVWVDTDFPVGTVLKDYSGGITSTTTVQCPSGGCGTGGPNRVNIQVKSVGYPSFAYSTTYSDHGAQYHGYAIWAPDGLSLRLANSPIRTTQEWEMADDLGDSNCESLTQGGSLPANRTDYRIVGKIFAVNGNTINYELFPEIAGHNISLEFYSLGGALLQQQTGTASFSGSFSATYTGWITAKIRYLPLNGESMCDASTTPPSTPKQKVWVKIAYDAPTSVTTASYPIASTVSFWTGAAQDSDWANCRNWEEGKVPVNTGIAATSSLIVFPPCPTTFPTIPTDFPVVNIDNRSGFPLPVELISFTAEVRGANRSLLKWQTATETNNRGFQVEKSTDSRTFRSLGFVKGAGNSATPQQYTFQDNDFRTNAYYRLKQEDNDGRFTYSKTQYLAHRNALVLFSLQPNPNKGSVELVVNKTLNSNVKARFFTPDGSLKGEWQGNLNSINQALNHALLTTPSGIYFLQMQTNEGMQTLKMVKE